MANSSNARTHLEHSEIYPASNYLIEVNNRNTRRCGTCSKSTIKTPERGQ